MKALVVTQDLLREAMSRRWFLALGASITLVLLVLGLSLRLDVVDGALAATRLFGRTLRTDIRSVDVALRPVFKAASYLIFYGGLLFGVVACADFGTSLLAPGRIEHLLALPVRRWELLLGTFLGVLALSLTGALYGASGMLVLFWAKTGVFTLRPLVSAALASVTFAGLYGAMLATAVAARSASLFLPRVSTLADAAADIAGSQSVDLGALASQLFGLFVFGMAALSLGIHLFDEKDF